MAFPVAVGTSLLLLYLWMVATKRTSFRFRSSREVSRHIKSRRCSVALLGLVLVLGAGATIVGERSLRSAAATASSSRSGNAYSGRAAFVAPALLVVGLFNLVAVFSAASAPSRHLLVWVAAAANAALTVAMYKFGFSLDLNATHNGGRSGLFSSSDDFAAQWVLSSQGASFPPQPLTTYHFLRAAPSHLCTFVPLLGLVILLRSVCFISFMEEEDDDRIKICRKGRRSACTAYATYLLGGILILISLILVEGLCRLRVATSVPYSGFSSTSAFLVGLLTATGMIGLFQGKASSRKTTRVSRLLLLVLSALVFIWAYRCLDLSDGVESAAARVRDSLSAGPARPGCEADKTKNDTLGDSTVVHVYINSKIFENSEDTKELEEEQDSQGGYGPPSSGYSSYRRRRRHVSNEDEVCFTARKSLTSCPNEDEAPTVVCVDKGRICDGVADVAALAHTCDSVNADYGEMLDFSFGSTARSDEGYGYGYGGSSYGSYSYASSSSTCGSAVSFPDESDCPRAVRPPLTSARVSAWAAMIASLAMLVVAGLANGGEREVQGEGDSDSEEDSSKISEWASAIKERLGGRKMSFNSDVPC